MNQADSIDLAERFQRLLARYAEVRRVEAQRLSAVMKTLLPTFLDARKRWAETQRATADDFNLFEVMGVAAVEVMHSKLLAWLLDHRIERGTHAQGNLGFRLFLDEFAGQLDKESPERVKAYAKEPNYWVHTELSGSESRVDIEIAANGRFLIHIENKIFSVEGNNQTDREWRDMQARAKVLGVADSDCHAFFLTLDACLAGNDGFHCIGWQRIVRVLDRFAAACEPSVVRLFARHYAKAVRKMCAMEHDELEVDHGEVHGA